MNRVLNKDFLLKSSLNSTLYTFSDVFHPASCMQSLYLSNPEESNFRLFVKNITNSSCTSRTGESDEEL